MIRPLLLCAAVTLSIPAAAQETRASAEAKLAREFAATDTNKDDVLTRAEVLARMTKMRAGAKDLDGTHAKRLTDLFFAQSDANKDGKITKAESQATMAAVFSRYDLNGDGRVDGEEAAQARAAARAAKAGKAAGPPAATPTRSAAAPPHPCNRA